MVPHIDRMRLLFYALQYMDVPVYEKKIFMDVLNRSLLQFENINAGLDAHGNKNIPFLQFSKWQVAYFRKTSSQKRKMIRLVKLKTYFSSSIMLTSHVLVSILETGSVDILKGTYVQTVVVKGIQQ